jgi:radical SAM superfamily enzyme YgiQ (UPF0313 family)
MKITLVSHKYGVPLSDPCCFPIGFQYISAGLKKLGHEVKVLNYNLWDYDFAEEIKGQDAVLFTGFDEFLPFIRRDSQICRDKGIKTVLGGALATFRTQEMAEIVDTVVVGEGDEVLPIALTTNGTAWGRKPDLSTVPWPDYDGFDIEEYHRRHSCRYMGVITSRGCPYSCSFCSQTCRYQERDLGAVFQEIDHYRASYGLELLIVNDNTLNVRKDRFMAFCEGMKGRGLGWSAAIRTDKFDEEMTRAAKDSGAKYFVVGVESFSQDRLDRMGKKSTVADNIRTLDLLEKYKIAYHGNILLGFDWDAPCAITRELSSIPGGYNVFPCLLQPFIGIKAKPGVFGEERDLWSKRFREYAEGRGMNIYPEAMVQ